MFYVLKLFEYITDSSVACFQFRSEWLHAFYLGKLCQKMGQSPAKALSYFNKAALLNSSGVDPVYRMHASRMKLLYSHGYEKIDILQVCQDYN